jgi:alpha-galactosidase
VKKRIGSKEGKRAAPAKPATPVKPATPHSEAADILFEVSADRQAVVVRSIANTASRHVWSAPDTAIGPVCVIGSPVEAFGPAIPEDLELAACAINPGKHGAESVTARWARRNGLDLIWKATRSHVAGVMEFQAEIRNTGSTPIADIRAIGPLAFRLAAGPLNLVIHHLSRTDYRKHASLGSATVKGGGWNSPVSSGWVAIEDVPAREVLFLGVEWESHWTVEVTPHVPDGGMRVSCELDMNGCDLAPGSSLLSPKVFLGVSHGDVDESLKVMHDHLRRIMPPLPKSFPWIVYDIWATEAQGVEKAILEEIPFAAGLGIDLFYIDASWYEGSDKSGAGNWFAGVGNYAREDREKYPGGLAEISKRVHAAGMKFGLWFAPQVVDARLVGNVIPPEFVARKDGKDIQLSIWNTPITQICTGNPSVVEHLAKVMSDAVERFALDWVKWDNSGLPGPTCNRADHGHQAADGALAALRGQYEIWRHLRERFPKLMLEECGYPSRMDYGLARTVTSHWLSDNTGTALGVRQGQIHASYVYPAAHNEAQILTGEGTRDPAVLDTIIRSRMMGLCGVGTLHGQLSERISLLPREVRDALGRNIKVYKRYRHLLREDVYHLLPPSTEADAWDAIEFCKRDGSEAVVLVFRSGSRSAETVIFPRGLARAASFEVTQVNSGEVRIVKGKELTDGVAIELPALDMSEILMLKEVRDLA